MPDFPYTEIRRMDGNYFDTIEEAKSVGYDLDQIWSVVLFDSGEGVVYGPPHHRVNLLGYVATKERHDHETYFEEEDEPREPDDDDF